MSSDVREASWACQGCTHGTASGGEMGYVIEKGFALGMTVELLMADGRLEAEDGTWVLGGEKKIVWWIRKKSLGTTGVKTPLRCEKNFVERPH